MAGGVRRARGFADMVAHMILYIWTISVAGLCALGVYTYVAEIALSPHSWVPTLLSFLITFGIMRFFVALLLDVYVREREIRVGIGGRTERCEALERALKFSRNRGKGF